MHSSRGGEQRHQRKQIPSHHVDEIMFPNMFLIGPSKFFMRSPRNSQVWTLQPETSLYRWAKVDWYL
jgi:hypothetical protein